jgi:hypothetical protein
MNYDELTDPELDALIAEKVCGGKAEPSFYPSLVLDMAIEVAEEQFKDWEIDLFRRLNVSPPWTACIRLGPELHLVFGTSPARALCIAMLKAKKGESK